MYDFFTFFWNVISKKRKKSCFLNLKKNVKYVFSILEQWFAMAGIAIYRQLQWVDHVRKNQDE